MDKIERNMTRAEFAGVAVAYLWICAALAHLVLT